MDVKTSQISVFFFILVFLPSGGDSAAASDSCLGLTVWTVGPAPGWIKHDQTLGVQMDLSIDPPFVSPTDQLMPFKLKNRTC